MASSFGLEIAAYIGLGFIGGPWLDHRWGTAPWFKLLGYVVGIGAPINAFVRITREYKKFTADDDDQPRPDQRNN
jgi:F0F1-type ATP synthase assembly protein I